MPSLKWLGTVDYTATAEAMRRFTEDRVPDTPDEIWLCEHPAVYTQGLAGRAEHLLSVGDIPVVASNRGGQVTYHGPGQVVAYPLVDLARLGVYVKEYVYRIEHSVIKTLEKLDVTGHRVPGAPGIYVDMFDPFGHASLDAARPATFDGLGKIAALGIKVSRHRTYHGVAMNVAMDLTPFAGINPCGYAGLQTIDLATLGLNVSWHDVAQQLDESLALNLRR